MDGFLLCTRQFNDETTEVKRLKELSSGIHGHPPPWEETKRIGLQQTDCRYADSGQI